MESRFDLTIQQSEESSRLPDAYKKLREVDVLLMKELRDLLQWQAEGDVGARALASEVLQAAQLAKYASWVLKGAMKRML